MVFIELEIASARCTGIAVAMEDDFSRYGTNGLPNGAARNTARSEAGGGAGQDRTGTTGWLVARAPRFHDQLPPN